MRHLLDTCDTFDWNLKTPFSAFANCTSASKSIDAACICIEAIDATEVEEMQVNIVFVFAFVFVFVFVHYTFASKQSTPMKWRKCWWILSPNLDLLAPCTSPHPPYIPHPTRRSTHSTTEPATCGLSRKIVAHSGAQKGCLRSCRKCINRTSVKYDFEDKILKKKKPQELL